eukprot:CAMPEP_0195607806 /NCGR_PEP_ID=MMETSP0815-20121206/8409_1 /TAXON_ID=97485 /ORGANISM="Prymnesium parvum, Strain Texoma1" /LENGTH=86 /DNA_ID=CAMNT_0040747627 /DNA_START=227 /DNA_END=487 /DNA_ORIENTATION=-
MNPGFFSHSPSSAQRAQPGSSSLHGKGGDSGSVISVGSEPSSASIAAMCSAESCHSLSSRLARIRPGLRERGITAASCCRAHRNAT